MSEGEDDATVNLVVSWTSLLPGDLFDCRNSSDDDSTCVGGVAATDAFARYYAKQQTANNETTTAAAAAEDGIPTLVLSYVDTISPFVQMHPLGWSLNRLVFNHLLGWNVCLSSPSILTQNSIDYQISQRDISDLQTLDMPLLLSNVFVPPGNSWFEYIKAVHFDTSTGLAVISIYNSKGLLNVNQIDTAKGVLNFIQQTNTESGCVDSTSLYSRYANETTRTTLSRCYLPVVLFEDASSDQFDAFVEAIVLHDYPPALIIDTTGNQANFSQPTRMGPSDDVWVHSFSLDQASYNQHTLTYSPDGTVLRNVSFSTEEFAALPEEARDETYRVNLAYLRALADEALESDPVVGTSGFMPLHRDNNIYRRCNGGECELGNLFADALRWSTDADVAFIKSGGFRGEGWPAGNVTISDIWRSLPFPNTICSGNMTGVSLFKLLDYSINTATFEPEVSDDGGQLLQVSGMKIAFNPKLEEHRIISIDVFDKENETFVPVERLRLYSFATDSYVCGGYDFYAEILGNSLVFEGEDQGFIGSVLHQDVVAAYLDQSGTYDTSLQSRLSNKTISNVPLNMIENPENCRPGSFYSDTRYSCEICPPNIKVHFLSEQIVMSGESGSVSIPIESIDLVNSELYNVSVALKSYPSWIKIAGNGNGIAYDVGKLIEIKSGEQITVEIWATPELLEPGTALATVAFSVVNGGSFLGCSWSDATFDILLRVTPTANLNQLGMVRVLGYSLSGIAVFTALFFCMWVIKRRKLRIVKTMQPVFLVAVCVGVSIMALSIVPMSIDDQTASDRGSDMACMAIPWLFSMGFTLSQSALFSKLWRINKLFNARQVRRMQVTEKDVIGPFALLFTLNFSFLLVLTLVDPVRFERVPVGVEEWNTYGKCSTGGAVGTTMFFLIVAVNLCAVAIACYQAYLARNVSDEFSESKRLGTVMFSWAQMMLVGLPVIFLIDADNPIARYFLVVTLTFALCESMLLLIFIPILLHVRRSRGTSIAGSTAIRDAIHKSTNPSAQHTAIGHTRITGISIESSGGRINEIDSHFDPPGLEDNTAGGAAVFHDHTLARDLCENDAGKRNGLGPSQAPIEHRSELKEPSVVTPGMAIDEASDRMETAT